MPLSTPSCAFLVKEIITRENVWQKGIHFTEAEVNRRKIKGQRAKAWVCFFFSLHEARLPTPFFSTKISPWYLIFHNKAIVVPYSLRKMLLTSLPVSFRGYCSSWDYLSYHFTLGLLKFRLVPCEDNASYSSSLSVTLIIINRHWERAWGGEVSSGQIASA